MSETVILFCPCCASAVDAESQSGEQVLTCESCGHTWTMIVDAERQAEHSIV